MKSSWLHGRVWVYVLVGLLTAVVAAESRSGEISRLGLPAPASAAFTTSNAASLGRRLFFDARLSSNASISCASCHQPDKAFSDAKPVAVGIRGREGTRNTPSVINAALHESQFWDGRRRSLEEQVLDPFVNPAEHGLANHEELLSLLGEIEDYRAEFRKAFDASADAITLRAVAQALTEFVRSLLAGDSAFDRYAYGGDSAALQEPAKRGLALFQGRAQCATCHSIGERDAAFTDNRFHNIGVGLKAVSPKLAGLARRIARTSKEELDSLLGTDSDVAALGRFVVTKDPADIGKFRTPTLRNVALTAPYMHDGGIATLEEAVDHELYYRGQSMGRPVILTPSEKADLVAFLRALTSLRLPR